MNCAITSNIQTRNTTGPSNGIGPIFVVACLGVEIYPIVLRLREYINISYPSIYFHTLTLSLEISFHSNILSGLTKPIMPSFISSHPPPSIRGGDEKARPRVTEPLNYSGSLDSYEQNDSTTTIGREILGLQIKKILSSPDADTMIRDLAITGKCCHCREAI
jgi:hypothetical protein